MDLTRHSVTVDDGTTLAVYEAGQGAPLILLHGFPQNHRCWLPVLPELARTHRCILIDLRGYGDSDAPADDAGHTTYSKRRMGRDVLAVLDALGIDRADVAGHDRGARVAYRFALDHPNRLHRLAILEVIPTVAFWDAWNADLAQTAYHWNFLAQPAPFPERLIAADPKFWVDWTLSAWTLAKSLAPFSDDALQSYRSQAADPMRVAAMCADYRAGFHTDRAIDAADRAAGRRIAAPLHFIWGEHGFPASTGDPAAVWRDWADTVTDTSVPSGHFAMEEVPRAVGRALARFFAD
ncbi:alpha/beta fold hydrolase [Jannaschia donghaensis]|uniref:Fluoroacetate dehalogenase n=1 Tax=Jannaschia donghaensis TaxID=420998 RepID=A0A0M6YEJ9_9RHOB|nr:alpha/beta hydrolase [Jannaschia donghaensis]CTQ48364.1 Fluoroacetate dehalogenase [Jannaschia donghaensis]